MQAILSELVRQERLVVVDAFDVAGPKTSDLLTRLAELGVSEGLIITPEVDGNLYLSSRNIPGLHCVDVASVNPVSLVSAEKVVITVDAVNKIQEWLG